MLECKGVKINLNYKKNYKLQNLSFKYLKVILYCQGVLKKCSNHNLFIKMCLILKNI